MQLTAAPAPLAGVRLPRARARQPSPASAVWPVQAVHCARSGSLARLGSVATRAAPDSRDPALATIEDVDRDYCDDFVCTSSPAVEQTVRALARDLARGAYSRASFQPDCAYDDGFRSFKGTDKLGRAMWVKHVLKDAKVEVTRMRMLDKGSAEIEWRAAGGVAVFSGLVVKVKSVVAMNLLTGRVTSIKETWDLSGLAAPASAALVASRVSWSAQQTSKDAQEGLNRTLDSLSSMGSMDEDTVYRDPTDPTRFFRQEDNTTNDAIMLCLLLAVLYAAYKAYATLFGA